MAESPAHKLGQLIGEALEAAIRSPLQRMTDEFGLYLDHKQPRPARNGKKKVVWQDSYGNTHDLDYVFEEGGTEEQFGQPRAFIEIAWRRYTKHSRNKAQEIQGAVLPLAETYGQHAPFVGAVLAGDFTDGSQEQLRSHGFHLAHVPYDMVVQAFGKIGVDVYSDENTNVADFRRKLRAYRRLKPHDREKLSKEILRVCAEEIDPFFDALRTCLARRITRITVLALSGTSAQFDSVESAIHFIERYDESAPASMFDHYELNVRYSNGREVRGTCPNKQDCVAFLRLLRGGALERAS